MDIALYDAGVIRGAKLPLAFDLLPENSTS